MACYPLAQLKAQQEIDNLTGGQRLPNYDDRPSLPYVEALFREVMRWRPVLPLGVPHAASDDDIYNGYYIPKGMNSHYSHFPLASVFLQEQPSSAISGALSDT